MQRRALSLLGVSLFFLPWIASSQTTKEFVIGQSITLQGGKNDYGMAVLSGVQAYLQDVNRRGGVNGRTIVLKTVDDDNSAAKAEANARDLVTKEKVFLLFGSIEGGPSSAVMKAAIDLNVPFFGPMAGSPGFRRPHQPLVFPVRAEHREEFRALLDYARKTGASRVAFVRSDSETGLQHLENVKRICGELNMQLVADLPFKSDIDDAQITQMARNIGGANAQVVINHGSAGMYERLIRRSHALGIRPSFSAVNSGSAQLVKHLGEAAHGMVFSQVMPSPWERKSAITREYQEVFTREKPGQEFSYGSLEGYVTAKALVMALRLAGPQPTRESFVRGIHAAGGLDIADKLHASYKPGDHTGLTLVDLATVTRDLKFQH
jgi:ABC-type branched-subunit amino acid transport system substrate-binding protein